MFKLIIPGFQAHHKRIELCGNKIFNEGVEMFLKFIKGNMGTESQLEYLSLYNCELEGKEACDLIADLLKYLKRLK